MHEFGLVEELVEVCERTDGDGPIRLVRVRYASTIAEASLRHAFALLTERTRLDGARLDAIPFDVEFECECGFAGAVDPDHVIGRSVLCPSCHRLSERAHVAELELLGVVSEGALAEAQ
jgi:Zn finger protein HypA/HybF involved in hydrogenase expression